MKVMDGLSFHWCGTCLQWTMSHGTATHTGGKAMQSNKGGNTNCPSITPSWLAAGAHQANMFLVPMSGSVSLLMSFGFSVPSDCPGVVLASSSDGAQMLVCAGLRVHAVAQWFILGLALGSPGQCCSYAVLVLAVDLHLFASMFGIVLASC